MNANVRIHDLPLHERPREMLAAKGAESLSSAHLIAILLRTGLKGMSAIRVAEQLVARYGTLEQLARAPREELQKIKGIGRDKAVTLQAAFTLARRMAEELQQEAQLADTPVRIADLLRETCRHEERESFFVVLVNTRRRLIKIEPLSQGTLDTILVHARDVFRSAIIANAAAVVIVHNHPSGDPTPSEADIKVTRDLIRAGQLLKIEVLDHIILGRRSPERDKDFVSLREAGYFYQ